MFYNTPSADIIAGSPIKSFLGVLWYEGHNIFNLQLGELLYNLNMEYRFSGTDKYLNTRRGSTLFSDIGNYSNGANNFIQGDNKYLVYVDSIGTLNAIGSDKVIQNIANDINQANYNDSFYYGMKGFETTYFANPVDGIYKVTNSGSFIKTNVLPGEIDSICFSGISGRMMTAEGHRSRYSNVQNQAAGDTSNLETFGQQASVLINPTEGEKIYKIIDNGEITFYLKDTGIWALINANEDPTNWIIPKCNADIGTKSPRTVKYSRYGQQEGFIYLASDKTLRYFSASVIRNAGVSPTLQGGDSRIISKPFQKLLNDIPNDALIRCTAGYFDRYYILCIPTAGDAALTQVIIVDTDKLMQSGESDIPQPYWFLSDKNFAKTDFVVQNSQLYGFSPDGYISQMLIEDIFYDEMPNRMYPYDGVTQPEYASINYLSISSPSGDFLVGDVITNGVATASLTDVSGYYLLTSQVTGSFNVGDTVDNGNGVTALVTDIVKRVAIPWSIYTGWYKFSENELLLYDVYVNWKAYGYWPLYMNVNSFIRGDSTPDFDSGQGIALFPNNANGNQVSFSNAQIISNKGQLSQNYGKQIRGNFFTFGFYNKNFGQPATLYSIEPMFKSSKSGPMGSNK